MPDKRRHRGPHPQDNEFFSAQHLPSLQRAVADLSWLLTREYSSAAALKLVGDRYQLVDRQRTAVMRCACSDNSLNERNDRRASAAVLAGCTVVIDGFNLITSVEAALSGGVLIRGRDNCLRDMAGMHGTYRKVDETVPALVLTGECLASLGVSHAHWLLDRPVSNSGRLLTIIRTVADENRWNWSAEPDDNPDRKLIDSQTGIVVSADSVVIENCRSWFPVANAVIESHVARPRIIDLRGV